MIVVRSLVATAAAALAFLAPQLAAAQEDSAPVSATGKGITGGALLGGEVALLTEAILDVKAGWAYLVGGVAGAGAGGVGGYYAEQMDDAKLSLYLLAGGMAFAIPTVVAVLSATAYEPPADYTEDQGPVDEPVAEPPQQTGEPPAAPTPAPAPGAAPPPTPTPTPAPAPAPAPGAEPPAEPPAPAPAPAPAPTGYRLRPPVLPPSLVGIRQGYLSLGVPAVEVREVFSRRELFEYGLKQQTEVRIPVFSAVF